MPKKKQQQAATGDFNHPDYEAFRTVEAVEEEIQKHKDFLVGKDKTESLIKKEKREVVAALNEQLKELNEEREHEIDVLSSLDQRRRQLHAQSNVVPLIPKPALG